MLRRATGDYDRLRFPIRFMMVLPLLLCLWLVAWPLLAWSTSALSAIWHIVPEAPVRGQRHGTAYLLSFLASIFPIMGITAAVSLVVSIAWLVLICRWAVRDAFDALVLCRYPSRWFKAQS